ncbi:zinc ribbon domain-containing protein [Bacillus cereus]|nr:MULTISPECIES: zinc ribbon domain-containing protein [Bacillus]AOM13331.1 hypothetical protein BTI247_49660 [Bacillus thuringiensis Bt18247]MBZ6024974.1 zinc ribbon domain-containing protein [Bacillus cereus]MDA2582819.1 zinc ribbon domain-containing protein [Bacillus cereus]MDA2645398.1 zinc ribbon domain-containing protein [Bacillus cereus]MDF9621530.1 zinc ribbon domain-containing protein [Bacillus cereus]
MRQCSNCGSQVRQHDNFCGDCGMNLEKQQCSEEILETNNEWNVENKKKTSFLAHKRFVVVSAIALIIVASTIYIFLTHSSTFNKMKGYWYAGGKGAYLQIQEIDDKNIEIVFYEKRGKTERVKGSVVDYNDNQVICNMSYPWNGRVKLELLDDTTLYMSEEGKKSHKLKLTKVSEKEMQEFYGGEKSSR